MARVALLLGGNQGDVKRTLQTAQQQAVEQAGVQPAYDCPLCQDRGYVVLNGQRRLCACRAAALAERGGQRVADLPCFADDTPSLIADDRQRLGQARLRGLLEAYVQAFPHNPKPNFVLLGQTGLGKDVSVILLMNEAFSDLTDQPMFNWAEETDPLPNLHALQKDPHTLSGHIVVPGFAGGTANTEFDVLTGMQTNALSVTATSAMRVVNRNLDSLFRVFGADGYRTSFYHPGDAWFYNRENVYRWLGAEHEVFAKDMKNLEYKGRWVTDDYMAGLIEEEFETAVSEGRPLFNYTTTIQNHMSYTADKYGEGHTFAPVSTTTDISPETRAMLEVYIEGVRDADAMLGRLTAYFSEREEPEVLVFYGDHLPYLGDNQKGYAELGSEVSIPENEREDILCSYKTPYVLWANDAAADTLNWSEAVAALYLPEDGVLSASFLGSVLLDLTGRAGESPWFDFLSSLRRIAPVVQKKTYILADGSVLPQRILNEQTDEASMELKDAVRKWRCWSYYKLKYADVG